MVRLLHLCEQVAPLVLDHKLESVVFADEGEILKGSAETDEFWNFTTEDRRAALEILRETKPNLPDEWSVRHTISDLTARRRRIGLD